jgi:hypothetical protein
LDKQATVGQRLRTLGAAWNAVTQNDATVFMTEAPVDALDALLRLEAARLQRPLGGIDAAVFAHERAVVSAESTLKGGLYTEDLAGAGPRRDSRGRLAGAGVGGVDRGHRALGRPADHLDVASVDDVDLPHGGLRRG